MPSWPPWLPLGFLTALGLPHSGSTDICGRISCCFRWWLGCPLSGRYSFPSCSLMEFLHQNGHSKSNIAYYRAVVRTLYIINGLPTQPFRDERVQLYLKALKITAPFTPAIRPTLHLDKLKSLLLFCDTVPHTVTLKPFISFVVSPSSDSPISSPTP